MTQTTKEILAHYQVRKSRKQKTKFIEYITQKAKDMGYTTTIEKANFGRNIVVGNPDTAKVIYTAHYDTCARLPFPNFVTPKNWGIYLLYQLAIVLADFAVGVGFALLAGVVAMIAGAPEDIVRAIGQITWGVWLLFSSWWMLFGPANKHTANDNTSGVTTLLDLMAAMPPEQKEQVAFVFFDLEEVGLLGSSGFYSKHKKQVKTTPVVNFDCVSDGDHILLVTKKKSKDLAPLLREVYTSTDDLTVEVPEGYVFYPSDQGNFPRGIGVAALKQSKRGVLYMNYIHTKKDVIYREENIAYLVERSVGLAEQLGQ